MASTYVNDLRLEEMATGDQSGTWGDTTNTNLELIAEAFSYGTQASFGSDADATTTIADGASDPARSLYLKVTSGASLTATRTLTIAPNTVSKIWIIENATSGSQSINISQGSGANVTIPNGDVKVIYTDGAGSGAAVVDAFTDLNTSGTLTATNLAGTLTTAAQTNITSVGTLSSLTVSGDLTVDTSTLKVDSTNNRVGIGTTSPSAGLHVETDVNPVLRLDRGSANNTNANLYYNGTLTGQLSAANAEFQISAAGSSTPTTFFTNGSEVARLDTTGNLLIGTTSGTSIQLHVDGSRANGLAAQLTNSDSSTGSGVVVKGGSSSSNYSADFRDYNNTNLMRLTGEGKLGLGTTSPQDTLHVVTDSSTTNDTVDVVRIEATSSGTPAVGFGAVIDFRGERASASSDSMGRVGFVADTMTASRIDGAYVVETSIDGTYSERMRISSSGNVGIGETTVNSKLEIKQGSSNWYEGIRINRSDNTTQFGTFSNNSGATFIGAVDTAGGTNKAIIFGNSADGTTFSEKMRVEHNGRVGIGVTSPNATLDVEGNLRLSGTNPVPLISPFSDGSNALKIDTNSTVGNSDALVAFENNDTELVRIDGAGRVGIAQDAPGDFNAAADDLVIGNSGGDFGITIRTGTASNGSIHFADGTSGDGPNEGIITYDHSSDHMQFNVAAAEAMRINNSQQLLIGNTDLSGGLINMRASSGTPSIETRNDSTGTIHYALFFRNNAGTQIGFVKISNTGTEYNTVSDYRLKENIQPLENGLQRLSELNPVQFDWKEDGTSSEGFIAHEVQEIFPDAVSHEKDGEQMQGMDYGRITPLLVKAIQEQQAQIEALQSEINELKNS